MRFLMILTAIFVSMLISCDNETGKLFYAEDSTLNFGAIAINGFSVLGVKIVNKSSEDIRISEFTITGENASEFGFASGNVPINLTANGGNHELLIEFNPVGDVGKRKAIIEISDMVQENQLDITLRGEAVA